MGGENILLSEQPCQRSLLILATTFTLFAVYGSLVPFEGRNYSFQEAVNLFLNIQYLQLGIASRADWIANALIYIPVGFFWRGYLRCCCAPRGLHFLLFVGLLFLVVAVEFLQIFISPRTVSFNDLLAEGIGLILGYGLWSICGRKLLDVMKPVVEEGRLSVSHLLSLYVIFYLIFSLFPYDFYLTLSEIKQGWAEQSFSFFMISHEPAGFRFIAFRIVDLLITLPIGLLACRIQAYGSLSRLLIIFVPVLCCIELLQIFMASGSVLFISVILKVVGLVCGWWLEARYPVSSWLPDQKRILKWLTLLIIPYLLVIAMLKGWRLPGSVSSSDIWVSISEISFIPFYYHYFVTEVRALMSFLVQVLVVVPLGCYLYFFDNQNDRKSRFWLLLLLAVALALVLELGGLFLSGLRPDPTNLLIAAVAAWASYHLAGLIYNSLLSTTETQVLPIKDDTIAPIEKESEEPSLSPLIESVSPHASWIARGFSVLFITVFLMYFLNHSLMGVVLVVSTVAAVLSLWRWPASWLVLLPAGIPMLDLYVLSGRFFLTELDALILLILAISYWRGFYLLPSWRRDPLFMCLLLALVIGYLVSAAQVLLPLPTIDTGSFYSYYSPYNALRIMKSLLWGLILFPLFKYQLACGDKALMRFAVGMLVGLLLVCLTVLIERLLFPGLFNFFSSDYRIKGSFSSMHTGGSHIDAYLVMTLPFIACLLLKKITPQRVIVFLMLLGFGLYTVFVTYSRAPFAICFILCLLMLAGFLVIHAKKISKSWVAAVVLSVTGLSALWLALPFLYETVLSQRIELSEQDSDTRLDHWRTGIDLVASQGGSKFWGNGPGSFPYQLFLERSLSGHKLAVHSLVDEGNNHFLRLVSGDNIYTSQYVKLNPDQDYTLKFKVRNLEKQGDLILPLCETWVLDSSRCAWHSFSIAIQEGWQEYQVQITMENFRESLGLSDYFLRRPIALTIHTGRSEPFLDVDELQVLDEQGNNILSNGSFEQGKDRWFFSADNHLLWHSKNVYVNLYHDFGLVGLALVLILSAVVISRLVRLIFKGNQQAVVLLASLCGFLGIGLVGSLFDVPQLSLLFYLLIFVSTLLWQNQKTVVPKGADANPATR